MNATPSKIKNRQTFEIIENRHTFEMIFLCKKRSPGSNQTKYKEDLKKKMPK